MSRVLLEVDAMHLAFGPLQVLRGVQLQLRGGELAGLVGPNGSGKTSLLRCIAGTQDGQRGSVRIAGLDIHRNAKAARAQLGFAVEPQRLPRLLTGLQCIELIADLRGETASIAASLDLCARLALAPWLSRETHTYSLGTRQKLAIVLALVGTPSLIVLDEVLNGLDPLAAWALKLELRARADAGAAVLLATHGLEVAERFLDRALLLLDGRIAADWDRTALAAMRADPHGGLEHAVAERLRAAG